MQRDEGPMLETLNYTIVLAVHQPFYISIQCISILCLRSTLRLIKAVADGVDIK